jgi:hypothetical protein
MPVQTYTTLDDPSATAGTFAQGINSSGQIVGNYHDNQGSGLHGFLLRGGTYATLDDTVAFLAPLSHPVSTARVRSSGITTIPPVATASS